MTVGAIQTVSSIIMRNMRLLDNKMDKLQHESDTTGNFTSAVKKIVTPAKPPGSEAQIAEAQRGSCSASYSYVEYC